MASASGAEVRGPVATMTLPQSAGGRPAISSRLISISGWSCERLGDGRGKTVAVDRERTAGRHLVGVGRAHDQRAEPAHFGVQQADGVVGGVVGAEGVGADELGQTVGAVRLGHPLGAHLMQHDGDAGIGDLPGGFRAGEARADDMDGVRRGFRSIWWSSWRSVSAFSRRAHAPDRLRNDNARNEAGVIRSSDD